MSIANNYNNQYYTRELISNKSKLFKKLLSTIGFNTCDAKIKQAYIDTSVKQFDYGYIYRDTRHNNNIVGFVLWNESKTSPILYIRLICGIGMGKLMFEDLENYATTKQMKQITLHPGNDHLKKYYMDKYGFKFKAYNKTKRTNLYYKDVNNITMRNTYIARKHTIKHSRNLHNVRKRSDTKKKMRNRSQNINNLNNKSIRERIVTLDTD